MHVGGILTHLGLVVAASISFLYHIGQATQASSWGYPGGAASRVRPCRYALMDGLRDRLESYGLTAESTDVAYVAGVANMTASTMLIASIMVVSSLKWALIGC